LRAREMEIFPNSMRRSRTGFEWYDEGEFETTFGLRRTAFRKLHKALEIYMESREQSKYVGDKVIALETQLAIFLYYISKGTSLYTLQAEYNIDDEDIIEEIVTTVRNRYASSFQETISNFGPYLKPLNVCGTGRMKLGFPESLRAWTLFLSKLMPVYSRHMVCFLVVNGFENSGGRPRKSLYRLYPSLPGTFKRTRGSRTGLRLIKGLRASFVNSP
jgi:hypothetical protein